jgi:hypothetical protein
MTAFRRDMIAFRVLYGDSPHELTLLHATVMNVEMVMELVGIITAPFLMLFFQPYNLMFNWFGGDTGFQMFGVMLIQLFTEIITDVICISFEVKKFDIYGSWAKIRAFRFLAFLCYGYCAMGILGMIYTSWKVPR